MGMERVCNLKWILTVVESGTNIPRSVRLYYGERLTDGQELANSSMGQRRKVGIIPPLLL